MPKIIVDKQHKYFPCTMLYDEEHEQIHAIKNAKGDMFINSELYEVIIDELHRQKKTPTQLSLFK